MSLKLIVNKEIETSPDIRSETPQLRVSKGGALLTERLEDAPLKSEQSYAEGLNDCYTKRYEFDSSFKNERPPNGNPRY